MNVLNITDKTSKLELLFEEAIDNSYDMAKNINDTILNLKDEITVLYNKLKIIKTRMNSNLAINMRRKNASLNIKVGERGCRIGYKSRVLLLTPDFENFQWSVKSNDSKFARQFILNYKDAIMLSSQNLIIDAIDEYFVNYYKSLNTDIIGEGIMFIEDKKATLYEVIKYRDSKRLLNTRKQ